MLSDKQRQFCREYLKDFNATAAYLRAGYDCSSETARRNASRMLTNADIQAYLSQLRTEVSSRTEVSIDKTVQEIARIAFSSITDILSFDASGVTFKDSQQLSEDAKAAIAQVKSTEMIREFRGVKETRVELSGKMHNKIAALTLLADFFGIRDDFNKARATLQRYGLLLEPDNNSPIGWRLERVDSSADASQTVEAIDQFTQDILN